MPEHRLKLAVIVSHPIQHFGPWHRAVAAQNTVDLRVFFCCDWGVNSYHDPEFGVNVQWDIPLTEGYEFEMLPIRSRPRRLGFWAVDNPTVDVALSRYRPDVLKLFGYAHRTNWRALKWARRAKVPVLLYSDSNQRAQPTGLKQAIKRRVVGRFYRDVDGALCVGDNNRAYHKSFGLPEERLFPGSLPIDLATLTAKLGKTDETRLRIREQFGIPQTDFVVLFSGKLIARKRPLDLLAALKLANASSRRVHVILVGEGDERAVLEQFRRDNFLDRAHIAGFVNQMEIPEFYVSADVLAVPSSFDPHPLVVTEAGVFGLPVIVSDAVGCVGATDTARAGENALVYPCGDAQRLADCIGRLASDGSLHRQMSIAARAIAETQDVGIAAGQLADAAKRLRDIGRRKPRE